jgi:hypothetical protein
MIEILKNEGDTIYYKCSCGVRGKCMIKPLKEVGAIIVNIKCAMCNELDSVILLRYKSEEERVSLMENINEGDFSWSLVLLNQIIT